MGLDLSIKQLEKALNTDLKRRFFLASNIFVTEKFDGTKLTLIRNGEPFDPTDYRKNWIVAYKGNVLYPSEYDGLTGRLNDDVARRSIGTSQYGLVHAHLQRVHANCEEIPRNTEFFLEFIQRKPTLTRDYETFHGMFLISYTTDVVVFLDGMHVFTTAKKEQQLSFGGRDRFAKMLELSVPPRLFMGQVEELGVSTIDSFVARFSDMSSTLGGKAEGVVIQTLPGDVYKVVAKDQYDKATRAAKKARWAMTQEKETEYWKLMNEQAQDIIDSLSFVDIPDFLSQLSKRVYSLKKDNIRAQNRKKDLIIHQDDLFLTAKLRFDRTNKIPQNAQKIGIFVMAGKPVHNGHWKMINKASSENDVALVYVSLGDRSSDGVTISSQTMADVWKHFLKPRLPQNVILRFSENPTLDCIHDIQALQDDIVKRKQRVVIYSDNEDSASWSESFRKNFPILYSFAKIEARSIPREEVELISGTKMRWMLKMGLDGHKHQFMMHLPQCLSKPEKEQVWNALLGSNQ